MVRVVVLDVVVQQAGLPERLGAAGRWTLERIVVQFNGENGRRLVLYHPVHWEARERGRVVKTMRITKTNVSLYKV